MKGDLFLFWRDVQDDHGGRMSQSAVIHAKDEASARKMLEADLSDIARNQDGEDSVWRRLSDIDWRVEKRPLDREDVISLWISR